jgi:phage terminase large subunit-like protein
MLAGCLGVYPPGITGKELPTAFPALEVGPKRYLIVGESFTTTLPEAVIPKLSKYITPDMLKVKPKKGSHGHPMLYTFKSGATLHLMSQDQGKDAFEGAVFDGIGIDEPPSQDIFNAIRRGTMATGGFIVIAGTPLKEPWMREVIENALNDVSDPNHDLVEVFRVPIWANCEHEGGFLPHAEIEAFLDSLSPKERAARESGEFADFTGLEFPYVTPDSHMVPDFF